ncbi:MAG: zinc-ribbon domain-containing protein [Candidatus Riflebacteria bacterium]|nr:zinc-ribbon domain-containing protein [Candidatus Riflebacteria bacterium]
MNIEKLILDSLKGEWNLKKGLVIAGIVLAFLMVIKFILFLLPKVIFLFLIFAPAIFVLADAQERKNPRPFIWAIFTLFTSVFGLIVYLISRPESKGSLLCNHCQKEIDDVVKFCPWCGNVPVVQVKCPKCSFDVQSDWKFCPSCRSPIADSDGSVPVHNM